MFIYSFVYLFYSTVNSGTGKKKSKLRVTGLCEGKTPVTGEFPTQKVSNAENDDVNMSTIDCFVVSLTVLSNMHKSW